ncbi:MAG: hypothetical protein K9N51_11760 [Candidatus Pacebacteria bacterium]|nr:hypothetical protein [Candidatus Paceibacterota bacterium]
MHAKLFRSFNTLFFGFAMVLLAALYESRSIIAIFGKPSQIIMIPVTVVAAAAFLVPSAAVSSVRWQVTVLRLRYAGLAMVGLGPFYSWHLRSYGNLYLTANGGLALLSAVWFLLELTILLEILFKNVQNPQLAALSVRTHQATSFVLFAPILTIYFFLLGKMWQDNLLTVHSLHYVWHDIPTTIRAFIRVAVVVPLAGALLLTWQAHRAAARLD